MQLKNVMKRSVVVVTPDTLLYEAAHQMSIYNVSVLPVCEGRKIVGLLTARDLTVRATSQGCDPRTSRVREVMMSPVICGREGQDVTEAADLMQRWQLRRLPVLDRRKHLVGIVSLHDLQGSSTHHRSRQR
jgi:CBS domain-containing protein